MYNFSLLSGPMRLPFLVLTPACVLIGLSTAMWGQNRVEWLRFILVLIGAFAAHLSVNLFNEYDDFKSGLDAKTVRTPFSGGSGTLPQHPDLAPVVRVMAWCMVMLMSAIGVSIILSTSIAILPLALIGLALILAYTPWITRHPILCLMAPGLAFGPLFVVGTDFVLSGHYSWDAFVASLIPFFLVDNLLLLNQFPDVDADRDAGRRTLPITIGLSTCSRIFVAFLAAPYLVIIIGVYTTTLPYSSLIGLFTMIPAFFLARGVLQHHQNMERLLPYMALNVFITVSTPLLLATGIMLGSLN